MQAPEPPEQPPRPRPAPRLIHSTPAFHVADEEIGLTTTDGDENGAWDTPPPEAA